MEEPLSQGASPASDGNLTAGGSGDINPSAIANLDERLLDIASRHTLNVLKTPPTRKAKRVRFFRNGDKYYTGVVMAVTPERYRSFDSLASDLTRALVSSVTLPNGVRSIYTMDGRKVQSVSDLEDGKCYVVSGQGEVFKKVEYSASKVRRGSSLSGLPQSPAAGGGGGSGGGTGRQTSAIPLCVKARIVTLIRHGTKPRKVVRLLLNKRNAPSLEHAMEAITEAVKLDSGAVRKVYTQSGQHVTSLEQFFGDDDIFVAYGPEKPGQDDFELDFEENKFVQSFRRCPWSSKRLGGPMPRMPRKSGKKTLTTPQVRTPSPSSLILPQPLRLHYTVGHVIGDGNFAVVRHCTHKASGAEYAMKIVDKYKCQGKETMLASEVAILRQVCHPNIISLIAEQETADQLFLVMELVTGGDLFDAIAAATKFSEAEASVMIGHLTSALAYLHSHHIVHRDVKPENLLVEMDGSHVRCLKLGDFGLAQVVREPLYTVCGTPTYVAPEILIESGYGLKVWDSPLYLFILLVSLVRLIKVWFAVSVAVLFLFFCPASVYQQSFLGGEQTAAATATDASAQQYRNQQCKPIRLATFEFDFKKQRSQRQDNGAGTEWKDVDHRDVADSIDIQQRAGQQGRDEIDFANGNYNEGEPLSFSPDYLKDIDNLSRSMHELIDNLNDNRTSRRRLKSRSAASSLNSIPENLSCNYHSSSSIRRDDIADRTAATPENVQGDRKNGNSSSESKYSSCETPKSTKSSAPSWHNRHNRGSLYGANRDGSFDTDDFRNSNATASTSSDSLTGGSSTGNDIETSDSFVNIQFARLARGQKSSSTQSMESTDSFENVSFRYTGNANNRPSQIPLKLAINPDKNKSPSKLLQTRIAALNMSKLPKLDNRPDRKNHNSLRAQETGKCTKNESVKLRHERYVNKKSQMNVRSKRYSCFSPCVTKRTPEEVGGGDGKVAQRRFSSTDELRDQNEQRQQKPAARTKRFSLYYTPPPPRKTYHSEAKVGKVAVKPIGRVHKSEAHKVRNSQEAERTDKSRRSVVDASTVASRSKSNRQNVHARPSVVLNANRTK
ncbi:Serine/threonine-protein kinase [Ooceraea biroi]|uniref:non-specific serine/threonine protein kinase n=1 Tax=Ooceraea biroi TaxID=2015173 RepID=A0A026VTZ9_OOCBI|nr:Serine/threonine-protein kinase [Ooceraea biroi]